MTEPFVHAIGIDPSLSCTSIVRLFGVKGSEPSRVDVARITTKPGDFGSPMARLDHMREAARSAVGFAPELIVIEGYAFSRNMAGQHSITEWGGVLRHMLYTERRVYRECSPSALKKYVCGKGNADKSIILREVHKRWGFDAEDDNDADAYALARLAWDVVSGSGGARAREAEAKLGGEYGKQRDGGKMVKGKRGRSG